MQAGSRGNYCGWGNDLPNRGTEWRKWENRGAKGAESCGVLEGMFFGGHRKLFFAPVCLCCITAVSLYINKIFGDKGGGMPKLKLRMCSCLL